MTRLSRLTCPLWLLTALLLPSQGLLRSEETHILVDADNVTGHASPYLTGACIEDVNHEIYGGLYSQMIFGESFQEPAPPTPPKDFTAYGGSWHVNEGVLLAGPGDGPKLLSQLHEVTKGEAEVEVLFSEKTGGNAGLVVKVTEPATGADKFTGYEVALETSGHLVLGRHRQNWEPLRTVPCDVPAGRWIPLKVRMAAETLEVFVDGTSVLLYQDTEHPLAGGEIGLRTWQREARFRNLHLTLDGKRMPLPFEPAGNSPATVSGMWRGFCRGSAEAEFSLEKVGAFTGAQSQRISFKSGTGEVGIENQSLNRWGMNIAGGKRYEGYVWVRTEARTDLFLSLENSDGTACFAQTRVTVSPGGWKRKEFILRPSGSTTAGRFSVRLKRPGSVCLGHVFLQPGNWGRFKELPVRRDVAEALVAQGLTVLRYGGSMINAPEYRWKKMVGLPERRPPYKGTWYPYSSNGWGIFDFLNFCEAAGFLGIPAVNMDESPADMADFIEYVNGGRGSVWGGRRATDGHPAPYHLKYLELGNEEAVDEAYWQKFKPIAEAIWSRDPRVVLVVGDFAYERAIQDPFNFDGAPLIRSLAAHKKILELARQYGREVWFDVHIGTESPPAPGNLPGVRSFIEQLNKLGPEAKPKVAIFEFNAGNHSLKRALANAWAFNQLAPLGNSLPIACSANCLQPDGQNDNGWDQGLLFLTPSAVWPQPPYFVTQMVARSYLPLTIKTELGHTRSTFDVSARKSEDGTKLVLQVVNTGGEPVPTEIRLQGFRPRAKFSQASVLSGGLDAVNTAQNPHSVSPSEREWAHGLDAGPAHFTFAPRSFTVLLFK